MIKVTVQNVTKVSEDHLYLFLADLKETDDMALIIEAELDRRNEILHTNLKKKQAAQIETLKGYLAIQEEIDQIFLGYKGKKTMVLIQKLGQEFIDDYRIDDDTFTVYSSAVQTFMNNPSSWECETIEQARSKMAGLIYDRIYNKFMRNACIENLNLLKSVLGE